MLPRRADARAVPPAGPDRLREAAEKIEQHREGVEACLANPGTDPALVAAVRAGSPLGAAVEAVALLGKRGWRNPSWLEEALADTWTAAHGPVFAAAACAELSELALGDFTRHRSIIRRGHADVESFALGLAVLLRPLIVSSDSYDEIVAALAVLRGTGLVQRAVISVMVPDEREWAEEVCAEAVAARRDEAFNGLLLTVVTSADTALALAGTISPWWVVEQPGLLHTFAAGAGAAAVPAIEHWLDHDYIDVETKQRLYGILAGIPADEAVTALVARLDEPRVPGAVMEAAGHDPERAVRVLAAAEGDLAARMLRTHLASHPSLWDHSPRAASVAAEFRPDPAGEARSLPPILATPPWTRARKSRKPLVATVPACEEEAALVWAPGEREAWISSQQERWGGSGWPDWQQTARMVNTRRVSVYAEVSFFLSAPDEVARPLIGGWRPEYLWWAGDWGKGVLARFETAALPLLLRIVRQAPAQMAPVLVPVASPEVALMMADWAQRLKTVRPVAMAWFARHPALAARALIPVAVGKRGPAREAAEQALRLIDAAVVREAGSLAAPAVDEILSVDPLTVLPRTLPVPPGWANPLLLPRVRLTGGRGHLPVSAVRDLITMLALSRLDRPYPGVALVAAECEPGDLAEFAWALFDEWRFAGSPAKQNWALDALGLLGDDGTVRRLAPVIRAWPGEGGHARAVTGINVLAEIGTDVALMYLNGIARKVKFKGLKERAEQKIAELAAGLGLTTEELADRLVPDLGLDSSGGLTLGAYRVGFDEQLKPYVEDASGKRLKTVPKGLPEFAALKKDVRVIAADQIERLEHAMVTGRRWRVADFRRFLVEHPLLWHLVRRLVWISGAGAFRLAEDRTFADVRDEPLSPGDDDLVGVAHPIQLGDQLADWAELFADYEILQPFPQLGRKVFRHGDVEVVGAVVPTGRLIGLERRGWSRDGSGDGGVQCELERQTSAGLITLEFEPGVVFGAFDPDTLQKVNAVSRLDGLDPITVSEVLRELSEVIQ
ncbi:DUF4132 domain-containing protein [Actinoplanes sp. NPDC051861]|uniref:DUF4132 domain-containing protein n=1 Tax=Actinoplanes sp. NPDC051861 TaxID=3155170 RepID=UPI00343281F8